MARKRKGDKPGTHVADSVRKLTFAIPVDLARRLTVHAAMLDKSQSQLLAEMIRTQLRRFSVHDHDRPKDTPTMPEPTPTVAEP